MGRAIGSCLALTLAAALPAQARADAAKIQAVTVTAPPAEPGHGLTRALAASFVEAHAAAAPSGQLARWTDPICPEVVGAPAEVDAYASERVKAVAAEVGAPVARRAKCATNIEIVFTTTPQAVLDHVARTQSVLLGFHYVAQRAALKTVRRPIQAWYLTATQNAESDMALDLAGGGSANDAAARSEPRPRDPGSFVATPRGAGADLSRMQLAGREPAGCLDSRLTHCLHSLFAHVLIVVDGQALHGARIGPIVDYVALIALSQPAALDRCGAVASIVDLLSAGCAGRKAPDALTGADLAYLAALYKTNLETDLGLEKSHIAASMARAAQAGGPP